MICSFCCHPCKPTAYRDGDESGDWWEVRSKCHGEPVLDERGREITDPGEVFDAYAYGEY